MLDDLKALSGYCEIIVKIGSWWESMGRSSKGWSSGL